MSGEHTPGPWITKGGASFTEVSCADGVRRGRLAANVYHEGRPGFAMVRVGAITDDPAEVMANTRLVAAAPDMLATLRHIAKNWPDSFAARDARAAIAKAEGRA